MIETGFHIDGEVLAAGERFFRQECRFVAGAKKPEDLPPQDIPEIAFVGRSNVGKSSLINALTGRKGLARASNTPGRTQQINFFELGDAMRLVDLPGYGFAVASKEKIKAWNGLMRAYLKKRRNLRRVCVLIDSRHGIRESDQKMMAMLDEAGVACIIVLTKSDKAAAGEMESLKSRTESEITKYCAGAFPKVYDTSSLEGGGVAELRAILMLL